MVVVQIVAMCCIVRRRAGLLWMLLAVSILVAVVAVLVGWEVSVGMVSFARCRHC